MKQSDFARIVERRCQQPVQGFAQIVEMQLSNCQGAFVDVKSLQERYEKMLEIKITGVNGLAK